MVFVELVPRLCLLKTEDIDTSLDWASELIDARCVNLPEYGLIVWPSLSFSHSRYYDQWRCTHL
jgi:hypothetical protein